MLGLQISSPIENKTVLYSPGNLVFYPVNSRDGLEFSRWYPKYRITSSGNVSGLSIDHLHVDLWEVPRRAQNSIQMLSIPNNGDTLTVGKTTYTFRPAASGLLESTTIKTYDNILATIVSIHKVLNNIGTNGVDYACPVNSYALTNYPSNPLIFEAVASGISGQNTYLSTTASGIIIANNYFYNGVDPTYEIVYSEDIYFPYKTKTNALSTNTLPTTLDGITYGGQAYFVNVSGLPVISGDTGETLIFTVQNTELTSGSAYQNLFEVSGLSGLDLNNGKIDSDRTLSITWPDVFNIVENQILPYDYPTAAGVHTQSTGLATSYSFGQLHDYYVFVCSGLIAPECAWPRPTDANVVWYLAGVTRDNYATVHVPDAPYIGVWVGFTNIRDGVLYIYAPYYRSNPEIYLT